jgi:hypothetical protein
LKPTSFLAALIVTASALSASQQTIPFQPGGTIRLPRSVGDLHVEGWDKAEVAIEAGKEVDVVRRSDTEVVISTNLSKHAKAHISYELHVPRNSRLVIDHRGGFVLIGNVTGDISATNRRGDIVLMLPEAGERSIDARVRFGHTDSDSERQAPSNPAKIRLRVGFGGISVKSLNPGESLHPAP